MHIVDVASGEDFRSRKTLNIAIKVVKNRKRFSLAATSEEPALTEYD
jgi:hypothetical protein